MNDATLLSLRICRVAARLFPEEFRALHSQPLLATSEDLIRDVAARRGLAGLIPMMIRLLVDIVVRIVAEHLRDLRQDARQALRVLGASPGFTLAAVLSIALGLGVSIGVFSQMQSMVLAPISGVREPQSLVTAPGVSFPVYEGSTELDAMATLRSVQTRRIGYGFLETLALPVIQGESFGPADRDNRTAPRVLVNETLAREFWTGGSPIGQTLELGARRYTVAGVVPDLPLSGIAARTPPTAFRLLTGDDLAVPSVFGTTLVVRTTGGDPIEPLRAMLQVTDPDVVLFDATTAGREAETAAYLSQINMLIYGGIGLFGLVLAAVGVSGITAYAVIARRKEIGIRLALGASRGRILGLVTHEAVVLVGVGMAVGLGLAYAGARLLGAWFSGLAEATGTTTSDPVLLVGAPALLGLLTMAGSWFPAIRALRIDPAVTLREE